MPVKINSSGGGSVTLTTPSTATDYTATFPANTGNVVTTGSSGVVTGTMLASATVTQSNLGTNVAGNGPAFSAYQSAAQTLGSGTFGKLQFQTKEFDTNTNFDATTNYRFTPTIAGYYQFSAAFAVATTATTGLITFYKNGSEFKRGGYNTATSALNGISMSALIYCNGSTDYVEVYGLVGTGQNSNASQTTTYFQGFLARSA